MEVASLSELYPVVPSQPLPSRDWIVNYAASLDPLRCSGVIVRDPQGRRLKVKSPQYVALRKVSRFMLF